MSALGDCGGKIAARKGGGFGESVFFFFIDKDFYGIFFRKGEGREGLGIGRNYTNSGHSLASDEIRSRSDGYDPAMNIFNFFGGL